MTDPTATAARNVFCELRFQVIAPGELVLQVAVAGPGLADEKLQVDGSPAPISEIAGSRTHGARQHLVAAQPGPLTVRYSAVYLPAADSPVSVGDLQRVIALRQSRYCPSDRMAGFARSHFARFPTPLERVRAVADYVAENVAYGAGTSDVTTDAVQTLLTGQGVCRDFAHLMTALCRAVDVPARVAAVYAPGLSPMDFHLVVETAIDGAWRVWDATRLAPRPALVRIGTGRDAADVAFSTVLSGEVELSELQITAVVDGDLPVDDHRRLVSLR
jgi:transglutaminase-like putative cysteine protease